MARGAVKIQKAASGKGHASSRSRTGDPACSSAMSDWKTKGMTPAIAAILGKCRAKAHARKQADMHRAAGNEAKAQVLEHRAASGVVGREARLARARELMAGRNQRTASASVLKPSTRAMLGQHKAVNAGGERPDGLTASRTIRAMRSEPMANTPSGYQIQAHTQARALELTNARARRARQLRDQRNPPTPEEQRHRRYHRIEGEVFRGTGGAAKAVQVSGTHHTDADFAQRVQARRDAAAKALKSVRAQRQNQTPAVERRLPDAAGQQRMFGTPSLREQAAPHPAVEQARAVVAKGPKAKRLPEHQPIGAKIWTHEQARANIKAKYVPRPPKNGETMVVVRRPQTGPYDFAEYGTGDLIRYHHEGTNHHAVVTAAKPGYSRSGEGWKVREQILVTRPATDADHAAVSSQRSAHEAEHRRVMDRMMSS